MKNITTSYMNNSLRNRVMARIYWEYAKNMLINHPDYVMFLIFISVSIYTTSIHSVLNNIPKENITAAFSFFVYAVLNTAWIIQAFIAGFLVRVSVIGFAAAYKNIKAVVLRWKSSKLKLGGSRLEKSSF